jgi:NAD(P)-dependent dehydrogenase (short-subunit alcohol dehydrogenase family)
MTNSMFSGRVAIVTGAGKGIGKATAIKFAELGANVILNGRSEAPLRETLEAIKQTGRSAAIVVGDVSDESVAKDTVSAALKEFRRLDFAVNNAGISPWVGSTAECKHEDWERVINTNLTGTWLGMKYQIPAMLDTGGGVIVNMASVAALMTFVGYSPYTASKWGVVGITKVAAKEFAAHAIRVNALAPGSIETPLFMDVIRTTPNSREDYEDQTPMKRIAKADEVAAAVIWLCSDAASYITGAVLPVDGGMTI